jgi:hypothetical protein
VYYVIEVPETFIVSRAWGNSANELLDLHTVFCVRVGVQSSVFRHVHKIAKSDC